MNPLMEPTLFTSSARGRARKTLDGYTAFFPSPLPRHMDLAAATVLRLDEATAAVNRLAGAGRLLPNPGLLVAPHVRLEAVRSSKIEGTQATVSDLLRYEAGAGPEGLPGDVPGDVLEVVNSIEALDHGVTRLRSGFPLSLRLIREVHERPASRAGEGCRLLASSAPLPTGSARPGCTLAEATFVPPPVPEMLDALSDFERFLHENGLPLLIRLAMAHYQLEAIHPFLDGNGRVGRLLIPLVLVDRHVLPEPLLYLPNRTVGLVARLLLACGRGAGA
ncbi:MAG: Fic family protein [Egibacteraceae bacterium]